MTDGHDGRTSGERRSFSRRSALKAAGALGLGISSFSSRASATSHWTLVVLPDTQKYAESSTYITHAHNQTRWVANNEGTENIAFVSHVGDLVEHGSNTTEWERIDAVMDRLDGVVPYATTVGNHDYATVSDRSSGIENYSRYFGKSRFGGYSWFGGSAPNDRGHYQRFSAGGYDFLHLDLEWGVPGTVSNSNTVMGWAHNLLKANRGTPTIITTHAYLWDRPGYEGHATDRRGANSGRQIYRYLVRKHPQVFMVLNGHYHRADGQWKQVSTNAAGSKIYEMLANYQHYENGGNGWMRLITFRPGGGSGGSDRIQVRTYSPSLNTYKTDSRSQFSFDLSFSNRF